MTRPFSPRLLLAYAALSAVYLLYLPYALPILDDWTLLQLCRSPSFLPGLVTNHLSLHFRMNWAGYLPVYGLQFLAGLTPWPYALLAWLTHLATAVLLSRLVSHLAGREDTGFLAGALYVVFPACNNILFLFVSSSYYYFQGLALVFWLWRAVRRDCRFSWPDLALLALIIYSGEQMQPALLLLPAVACLLWRRTGWLRGWLAQAGATVLLVGVYYFAINRYPLTRGLDRQTPWSLRPVSFHLFGSLGLQPDFAQWRPHWQLEAPVIALVVLAALAFFLAWPRSDPPARGPGRAGELLLFSVAGVILTYLPVAWLASFEWRYLYVPSLFLVTGGAAILSLLPPRARPILAVLAIAYSAAYTYYEMRQCWIPQSRAARAQLEAVTAHRPYRPGEIIVLAGSDLHRGTAPDFITGASWSLRSVLSLVGGTQQVWAGREIVAGDRGELFLFQGDAYVPLRPDDLTRVRYLAPAAAVRLTAQPLPPPRRVSSHEIALRLRHTP